MEEEIKKEDDQKKLVNITTVPSTGEQVILNDYDANNHRSFEDIVKMINNGEEVLNTTVLTKSEMSDYLKDENNRKTIINDLKEGTTLEDEDIQKIIEIADMKLKGEKFNVYEEFPQAAKNLIDGYIVVNSSSIVNSSKAKRKLAEDILDRFIYRIQFDRSKIDFAVELQKIYEANSIELNTDNLEFIDEKNKLYRTAADQIKDKNAREKVKLILDMIDEARSLSGLKEFAKKSKIKKIEIEKPIKVFSDFRRKYETSSNNIYDIYLAHDSLLRNMKKEGLTEDDIDLFLIDFCHQVRLYSTDNPLHHAYMYYVMYYCVMLDSDTSDTFKNNIKEVILNAKIRNSIE